MATPRSRLRKCVHCGALMDEDKRSDAMYCSKLCGTKASYKRNYKSKKGGKVGDCSRCGKDIPRWKRSDSIYCSDRCRGNEEKLRYKSKHPEYVARQNKLVREIHHMKEHGHTRYINDPKLNPKDRYARARAEGFRSMLEVHNARLLEEHGVNFEYEKLKIKYTPNRKTYTPDLVLPNGVIIETKGRFMPIDRAKHLLIKEQHPDLDIRFVFSNSNTRLSKRSTTTYADWCVKHGFKYADQLIPLEWIKE